MPSEERPSDVRAELALEALTNPIEKYRSAIVTAAEEVRGLLATEEGGEGGRDDNVAAGLGPFAAGRIDVSRFAKLLSSAKHEEDPDNLVRVEKAFEILRSISSEVSRAFYLKVSPGTRLRDAVANRLSDIGRGFAAARIAGLAALGALNNGNAEDLSGPLGFDAWSSGERSLAPPLVVELEGSDLHATELAEFLDGNMKMVLLVNGDAPPAPLVRLITPRTFVLQTTEVKELARFAAADPPAIVALLPDSAARFVHDPALGERIEDRLAIHRLPESPPRKKLGGISARQQQEELDQLRALASATDVGTASAVAPEASATQMTSVDKLASWLLSQTDLSSPE
jgi:hypothetical protein